MTNKVIYIRNPYPIPEISHEGSWKSQGPIVGKKVSINDRQWNLKLNTHERLFAHHTLASIRKDQRLHRPKVPNDSLDLALASVYVHSEDTLVPKMYVPMQPESLGKETWRVLRNRMKISPEPIRKSPKDQPEGFKCYGEVIPKVKLAQPSERLNIAGHHSVLTNPGYSRKLDGTMYNN